jgi:hypothetical protein
MQGYLASPAGRCCGSALTRKTRCGEAHREQTIDNIFIITKPDLLARLISRRGNQDRRVSSYPGIPGMRITFKTHHFTTSYTITP